MNRRKRVAQEGRFTWRGGTIERTCSGDRPQKCIICAGPHKVEDHQCGVAGCKKGRERFVLMLLQSVQIVLEPMLLILRVAHQGIRQR